MIFPLKPPFIFGIFHGYVSHNKRVKHQQKPMVFPMVFSKSSTDPHSFGKRKSLRSMLIQQALNLGQLPDERPMKMG
jgi:hypothetical protein